MRLRQPRQHLPRGRLDSRRRAAMPGAKKPRPEISFGAPTFLLASSFIIFVHHGVYCRQAAAELA